MSIFAIGDLHLSFGTDKPMDIFSGWQGYESKLKENWNNMVTENDVIVIPGDISWAMNFDQAEPDFRFINNDLKGRKIILKGNHDYWWNTVSKMKKFLKENQFDKIEILHNNCFVYEDIAICGTRGWFYDDAKNIDKKVLLREAARLETSIAEGEKTGNKIIVFLHYPPVFGNMVCDEMMDVLKRHEIRDVVYGHIHGKTCNSAINGSYQGINFKLVSCDFTSFSPVLIK